MKLEDQAAKKSIIKVDHEGRSYKLGVIDLPALYLTSAYRAGDPNYKSTTRDVKKLVAELQKDKVDGTSSTCCINGGGSLQRATELTGLFIDQGPTVLVRNSGRPRRRAQRRTKARLLYRPAGGAGQPSRPPPRRSSPAPCRTTTAR